MKKAFYVAIEIFTVVLLIGMIMYLRFFWDNIPEEIPTHFNLLGKIDHYGDKKMIFLLPAIAWLIYGLMTLMQKYPKLYVWAKEPGQTTANHQLQMVVKDGITLQKGLFVGVFLYIFMHTVKQTSLNPVIMLFFLVAIFSILFWEGRKILKKINE